MLSGETVWSWTHAMLFIRIQMPARAPKLTMTSSFPPPSTSPVTTSPVDPYATSQELPWFEPVGDLPLFEPVVSDTGPVEANGLENG